MFHHHSALGRALSYAAFLVLSLTAVAVGLLAFNIDVLNSPVVQNHLVAVIRPAYVVIGLSGILGLVFLATGCGSCKCDTKNHHHNNH